MKDLPKSEPLLALRVPGGSGEETHISRKEFIDGLHTGSIDAFVALAATYKTSIFQFIFRLHPNPERAEFLLQRVLLRAYRSHGFIRYPIDLSVWLFRIAWDLARIEVRNAQNASLAARGSVIQQAVGALGEKQRVAVLLHKFAGLNRKQIAAVLKVSESAAGILLLQAYRLIHVFSAPSQAQKALSKRGECDG